MYKSHVLSVNVFFKTIVNQQEIGVDISPYPGLAAWYENCKSLPGFEENQAGAKIFAERVLKNLVDKF
jgi:glutathione S-transferase